MIRLRSHDCRSRRQVVWAAGAERVVTARRQHRDVACKQNEINSFVVMKFTAQHVLY